MDTIKKFLARFSHLEDPKEVKQKIINIICEYVPISLTTNQIDFKFGLIKIKNIPAVFKNEIFINKSVLISRVEEVLNKPIKDITF